MSSLRFYILQGPFFGNENYISIFALPKNILGGGFVDNETNTYINVILHNLNSNSTKPPPKMFLGTSRNEEFQWRGPSPYSILVLFHLYLTIRL